MFTKGDQQSTCWEQIKYYPSCDMQKKHMIYIVAEYMNTYVSLFCPNKVFLFSLYRHKHRMPALIIYSLVCPWKRRKSLWDSLATVLKLSFNGNHFWSLFLRRTRFPCLFWVMVQTIQNQNRFLFYGDKSGLRHNTFSLSLVSSKLPLVPLTPQRQMFPAVAHVHAPACAQLHDAANVLLAQTHSQSLTTNILHSSHNKQPVSA